MATASLIFFQDFKEQLGRGVHNFGTHNLKIALTNTAPNVATATMLADIAQIASGAGYAPGGFALTGVTWTEAGGTGKLTITDLVITATGGAMAPFRYLVLYNDSAAAPAKALIGYFDNGSALTLNDTDSLTLDFDATAGVLTLA